MLTILSGGQTGIDRMALDLAMEMEIPHSGWCPKDRRSEDGAIAQRYQLTETDSRNYAVRTKKNIDDSDGTLIFHSGVIGGGTELTVKLCQRLSKPLLVFSLEQVESQLVSPIELASDWLRSNKICILNIAGPRLSSAPNLPERVKPFLRDVLVEYLGASEVG